MIPYFTLRFNCFAPVHLPEGAADTSRPPRRWLGGAEHGLALFVEGIDLCAQLGAARFGGQFRQCLHTPAADAAVLVFPADHKADGVSHQCGISRQLSVILYVIKFDSDGLIDVYPP